MTIRLWIPVFAMILAITQNGQGEGAAEALQALLREEWEYRLEKNPLFATHAGDHRYDDRLGTVSLGERENDILKQKEFLDRLEHIDREQLNGEDQINYDLFQQDKYLDIAWYEVKGDLMPVTQMGGFYSSFAQLPERLRFKTVKDYENYICRLREFPAYTAGHIELMREGIRQGMVLPQVVMDGLHKAVQALMDKKPGESRWLAPFETFPDSVEEKERERLKTAGLKAVEESVYPAYREFQEFLAKEYAPAGRAGIAATALPNGKEFYRHCIRTSTSLELSAEEIHRTGLSEVKRIRAEMEEKMRSTGFQGTQREFADSLRNDERFYAKTPEELLKEAAYIAKRIDGELPKLFGRLPRMPFGLKEVPDYIAPKSATAYYMRPPGDGRLPGYFYVNTYNLKTRPLYLLTALTLHEAMPGHHLQSSLQQEMEQVPPFRRYSWNTAYGEGWALYAESLGKEMGMYDNAYQDFGRLGLEIWRAARLVVDTGMHAMGWTRQQAIDYFLENTLNGKDDAETEIDRYIVWPGQALAYKIGEMKFQQLRREAQTALGMRFDLRAFHDEVLRYGPLPLVMLEHRIREWIDRPSANNEPDMPVPVK